MANKWQKKSYDGFSIKAAPEDATGKFVAYGNVFGVKDHAGDITVKGCFANCIKSYVEKGKMPRLLGQHGHRTMPLGIITNMIEDEKGLKFDGQFCLETQAGAEAYALCKMGAIDQFSIGYSTIKETVTMKGNMLEELDVKEISLVTFACNEESELVDIKSLLDSDELTPRILQKAIREAFGLSKRESEAAINAIKSTKTVEENEIVEELTPLESFRVKMSEAPEIQPWEGFLETKAEGELSFQQQMSMVRQGLVSRIFHTDFYLCDLYKDHGFVEFWCYVTSQYKFAKFDWQMDNGVAIITDFVLGNRTYDSVFVADIASTEEMEETVKEENVEVSEEINVDDLETKTVEELAALLLKADEPVAEESEAEIDTKNEEIDLETLDLSKLFS